jgi:hypothetical protein
MAGKLSFKLSHATARKRAAQAVLDAPEGFVVEIREPTRNLSQNALLWQLLGDISRQQPGGRKLTPDDWKILMMHACGWECAFLEGLDGRPFPAGFRSSKMTVRQMADLITFILAWGNENGIRWSEPEGLQ